MHARTQFNHLGRRPLSDDIYDVIRERIVTCDLAPGQQLAVGEIARQMGVSPTPVKDALRKLLAEGLINIQPRIGTYVTRISAQDIQNSFELREAIETKACELLAGKIDAAWINTLRAANEAIWKANTTLDRHVHYDGQFHRLLVESSGNRRLIEVYSQLNAHLQIARLYYGSENWTRGVPLAREEHAGIVAALAENQIEQAKEILQRHIRRSMELLVSDLDNHLAMQHG